MRTKEGFPAKLMFDKEYVANIFQRFNKRPELKIYKSLSYVYYTKCDDISTILIQNINILVNTCTCLFYCNNCKGILKN